MEYNYNIILEEIRKLINKSAAVWLGFIVAVSLMLGILCAANILPKAALWAFLGIIPTSVSLVFAVLFFHKRAETFTKKQQLSMMAFNARKAIDTFQRQFPDTFIGNCHIRMRYLAKNGVHVDSALKKLDGSVDAYNQRVLSFLGESDKLEDELYDLMQRDTILQYAHKAHILRILVSELGITKLTDTVFFHEIQAYAGNLEVVRDNWEKLSFELDEAYDIFFEYIKAPGAQDSLGKEECQMTCKRWDERLQEAFNALETYDTIKAKMILNELINYQIDADINKTLQGIITSIDEIMAN